MQLPFMLIDPSMLEPNVAAVCGEHEFIDTQPTEFMPYVGVMGLMELTTALLPIAPPPPAPLLIATESEYDILPDSMVTRRYTSCYQRVPD
jgi:hypothetical protein